MGRKGLRAVVFTVWQQPLCSLDLWHIKIHLVISYKRRDYILARSARPKRQIRAHCVSQYARYVRTLRCCDHIPAR